MSNMANVTRAHTLKERIVIEREVSDQKWKNQVFNLTMGQKCINLKDFCLRPQIESEISGVCG